MTSSILTDRKIFPKPTGENPSHIVSRAQASDSATPSAAPAETQVNTRSTAAFADVKCESCSGCSRESSKGVDPTGLGYRTSDSYLAGTSSGG